MAALWVGLAVIVFFLYKMLLQYREDRRREVRVVSQQSVAVGFVKGLLRGFVKRAGFLSGPVSTVKLVEDVDLSPHRIAKYEAATLLHDGKAAQKKSSTFTHLSLCFPQVLSVGPSVRLFVDQGFPMSPLGILHFRQIIQQKKPLSVEASYYTEVFFNRYPGGLMYQETDKGVELTIRVLLIDKKNKETVWEGDTIVLSRGGRPPKRTGPPPKFEAPVWDHKSLHSVSNKTGLIYSDASGDFNPIHLYWWSALPMGFSRPIAHGMWSLSAAMHELEALGVRKLDAYPVKVVCDFKKPLFMPGKVTFGHKKLENGDISFGVYDKNNVDPHLMCTLSQ